MIPNVIELAYYSNSLVPHFALDSIMVTALHTMAKEHERNYPTEVSIQQTPHNVSQEIKILICLSIAGIFHN